MMARVSGAVGRPRTRRRLLVALPVVVATTSASLADAMGPLPEGENGYFCKTHDGSKRLFRRGDFYFCGTDAHLPTRITYAVIGAAPDGLAAALRRFGDKLGERTGVAIEESKRPDVLLVAAPLTPPPPGREAHRRAVESLLAASGVSLPPDLDTARHIGLDLTAVFSEETTSAQRTPGRPVFTTTSFYPGPYADLTGIVKEAFTTYLAIAAPMVRPEEVAPNGVSHAPRLRPWLDP